MSASFIVIDPPGVIVDSSSIATICIAYTHSDSRLTGISYTPAA